MTQSRVTIINENDRSLIQLCLGIARDEFKNSATSVALPRISEQFARQVIETERLMASFEQADEITMLTGRNAFA